MDNFRNQVLIFEDDRTLSAALKAAFEREGFVAYTTTNPNDARELLALKPIGVLVIDCLLPEMSGVEFVESIRSKFPTEILEVILMSGIFVDPSFIKDSLRTTAGKYFLKKPFDLSQLLSLVEKPVSRPSDPGISTNPRMRLYQMFSQEKVSARDKRKALEALDEIHGFDLPFIYSLLVESQFSGHLNLVTTVGEVFGLSLSNGNITNVDIPDKETYIGKLLVDKGYLHPDDLLSVVKDKSQKKFGEKLTKSFMVSPHALDMALSFQMNIRLSKTIVDKKIAVNLVETKVELTKPYIEPEEFAEFLHDWIASKISVQWLRAHYVQWMIYSLEKTPSFRENHPALLSPLVQTLPNLFNALSSGASLSQILDSRKFIEEPFYKALHYLLTSGLLVFSSAKSDLTSQDRMNQLNKIYAQFNGLNKVEIFDLITQMVGDQHDVPELVIQKFSRFLGRAPSPNEKVLFSLYQQLTNLALHAFEFVKSGKTEKLKDEMAKVEVVQKMQTTQQFEEAKNHLQKSSFKVALDLLHQVQDVDPKFEKLRIYLSWARLGMMDSIHKEKIITEVEMEMIQIPPEEKFDAIYSFVQGLLAKARGDFSAAHKLFAKAMSLDPTMIVARREMTVLAGMANQKKGDMFNKDLKDVFGSIFRKKS